MENLLRGCQGVCIYLDDILISGSTTEEHLRHLDHVLQILETAGLRLNKSKCAFMLSKIEYLGHVIDESGLHPTQEKVKAIQEAPEPKNLAELRSFLGMINYYSRFLPNLSHQLAPLYKLLKRTIRWHWKTKQAEAFQLAKTALQADSLLVHYDPKKQIVVACDASPLGLGAVLSHIMPDGQERPIAYASRTLTAAERGYSQIEKEGLAVVFAVTKFHNYLYGRSFIIQSDHQPLSHLFNQQKAISVTASARIQRWALTLSAYHYTIHYKPGQNISNADALSRLPRPITTSSDRLPGNLVHLLDHLSSTTFDATFIKKWTNTDPVLAQVRNFCLQGWPRASLTAEFKPYVSRKDELSILDGCVLWGSRIVIPPQGRTQVLNELHEAHTGASKMKMLARAYVWWPKLDSDIEQLAKNCTTCQATSSSPPKAPLHPWEWPARPWSRLHLDFAGPFLGHMFLVLVDAHSKWLNVEVMQSITAEKTIQKLRTIFATHRIPHKVVTDNGPTFRSEQFQTYMKDNGIKLIFSAPYHPSSNGLAERAVQTVKQGLRQMQGPGTIQDKLSRFLFKYRITPHTTTGIPPCELLMNRRLRSKLDLLHPDTMLSQRVEQRQQSQKMAHDSHKPYREFKVGDTVYAEDFTPSNQKWIEGVVTDVTGPLSYKVRLNDGTEVRRHVDSVKQRTSFVVVAEETSDFEGPYINSESVSDHNTPSELVSSTPSIIEPTGQSELSTGLRRSSRIRRPPQRYTDLQNYSS